MSESDQTLSVVCQIFAAFAAHDLDAFRDLLQPDVVLHVGGGPTTFAGIDAVVATVSVT
jgi:ketosteroid isomerase-like protein